MSRFIQSLEGRKFFSAAAVAGQPVEITNYRDHDQLVIVADNGKSVKIPMLDDSGMPNVFAINTYNADGTFDVTVRPMTAAENASAYVQPNVVGITGVTCGLQPGLSVEDASDNLRDSWAEYPGTAVPEGGTGTAPESQDHVIYLSQQPEFTASAVASLQSATNSPAASGDGKHSARFLRAQAAASTATTPTDGKHSVRFLRTQSAASAAATPADTKHSARFLRAQAAELA